MQEAAKSKVEYRFYRTRIPIFAEGNVASHVIDKINEDPIGKGITIRTQCGRSIEYTHTNGFDRVRNAYVVSYRKGVKLLRVAFSCDAHGYVMRMNRCLRCGFNAENSVQYARLDAKHIAVSTIVQCIVGSELEQFVLSQPCDLIVV